MIFDDYRHLHNHERPHHSLGLLTPVQFAKQITQGSGYALTTSKPATTTNPRKQQQDGNTIIEFGLRKWAQAVFCFESMKAKISIVLMVLAFLSVMAFAFFGESSDEYEPVGEASKSVSVFLSVDERELKICFQNKLDSDIMLLKFGTPFESLIGKDFLRVSSNGSLIKYTGPIMAKGDPRPDDFIELKQNGKICTKFNVVKYYKIEDGADYEIEYFETVTYKKDEGIYVDMLRSNSVDFLTDS